MSGHKDSEPNAVNKVLIKSNSHSHPGYFVTKSILDTSTVAQQRRNIVTTPHRDSILPEDFIGKNKRNRDATEGSSNHHAGGSQNKRIHTMAKIGGPKNINIIRAADNFLQGRIDALNKDDDSEQEAADMRVYGIAETRGNLHELHVTHDEELHGRYPDEFTPTNDRLHYSLEPGRYTPENLNSVQLDMQIMEGERRTHLLNNFGHNTVIAVPMVDGALMGSDAVASSAGETEGFPGKKVRPKYRPSRPPLLPPCRVCGDRASGFHYGVNTCEACKGFFRRSICKADPYVCTGKGDCRPIAGKRTACSHCRFRRCIEVGMSKTAIKTGRYTHELRSKNILEVKRLAKQNSSDSMDESNYASVDSVPDCCDELKYTEYKNGLLKKMVFEETLQSLITGQTFLFEQLEDYYDQGLMLRRQRAVYDRYMNSKREDVVLIENNVVQMKNTCITDITDTKPSNDTQFGKMHSDNKCGSDGQNEAVSCSDQNDASQNGDIWKSSKELDKGVMPSVQSDSITHAGNICDQTSVHGNKNIQNGVNVTSPSEFMKADVMSQVLKDIEQGVNGMLAFAKYVPGFEELEKDDKASLIKSARFDVWYIGHIRCFNVDLEVGACEWQFHADELAQVWGRDLIDIAFRMSRHGHSLDLTKEETAALRAVCITMPDRCFPLNNPTDVEDMNKLMWDVFQHVSEKRRGEFSKFLPKVIDFMVLLREFGIKFEAISSQLMLDWSILKENPLLLSVFLT